MFPQSGSVANTPVAQSARRKLLVKASSHERWSSLMLSAAAEWDITWVLDDEQFAVELSQGKFAIAAIETTEGSSFLPAGWAPPGTGRSEILSLRSTAQPRVPTDACQTTTFIRLQSELEIGSAQLSTESAGISVLTSISPDATSDTFKKWLDVAFQFSQLRANNVELRRRLANRRSPIVGNSVQINRLREQIATSALNDWPVLIQGEAGTGRDLVARAIHEASERSHRPFVAIDCRVHSSTSLGRELFGHAAILNEGETSNSFGSSSGFGNSAHSSVAGRIDLADGGVLLINGIDEIALPLQGVLAQVLGRKLFQRIGERQESPLNVRVLAVTSKDLFQLSAAGHFREDLLQYFAGPVLKTPVLREIRSDIATLTEHLLHRISTRLGCGPIRLLMDTLTRLQAHDWPGNVGELESLLERACLLNPEGKLTAEMIDTWLTGESLFADARLPGMTLAQLERQLIEATFARCAGNRELTAQSLQIGLRTLSGKLREYGYPPRGGPGSNRQQPQRDREAA
jgi:DNA-binding NtrC family response regulator